MRLCALICCVVTVPFVGAEVRFERLWVDRLTELVQKSSGDLGVWCLRNTWTRDMTTWMEKKKTDSTSGGQEEGFYSKMGVIRVMSLE